MLRTRDQWFEYAIERGTSGDMVFDILKDWKEEREAKERIIREFMEKVKGMMEDAK